MNKKFADLGFISCSNVCQILDFAEFDQSKVFEFIFPLK